MLDVKTNVLIWGLVMSTTMKALVHLGPNYNENLVGCKNTNFKELRALFDITHRLIWEPSIEILNVCTMILRFTPWMRSTFVLPPSNQMGASKNTRLLRFSFMSGKMYAHTGANAKMERSTLRL